MNRYRYVISVVLFLVARGVCAKPLVYDRGRTEIYADLLVNLQTFYEQAKHEETAIIQEYAQAIGDLDSTHIEKLHYRVRNLVYQIERCMNANNCLGPGMEARGEELAREFQWIEARVGRLFVDGPCQNIQWPSNPLLWPSAKLKAIKLKETFLRQSQTLTPEHVQGGIYALGTFIGYSKQAYGVGRRLEPEVRRQRERITVLLMKEWTPDMLDEYIAYCERTRIASEDVDARLKKDAAFKERVMTDKASWKALFPTPWSEEHDYESDGEPSYEV